MSERTEISTTTQKAGESVLLKGWVHRTRDHGKVFFLDLRDRSGIVQMVTGTWKPEVLEIAQTLSTEDVLAVKGLVKARPEKLINADIPTGTIEVEIEEITIINKAALSPFILNEDTLGVDEELRLKYRYLDLRTERVRNNIQNRAKIFAYLRTALDSQGFVEIETPLLSASTPEGSRDFVVPTRSKGHFFALPQSPQQYKQLLMVAGLEKYYQFPRCFRDEDSRGDRQPEFTQLDLEMSFVEQEDVMRLNEELLIGLVQTLYPEKKIQEVPFPRISYKEAMEKHGTDRPDLRTNKEDPNLLAFCWVVDFPFFERDDEGGWTFTHNPFSMPKPEHMEWLNKGENIEQILTTQYDVVLNGCEIGGGSIRDHLPESLHQTFRIMGYSEEGVQKSFGHMIEAFSFGAPPHGGIAWGFDRLVMLLQNEPNIREVMAFPKTGEGRDPLMSAPTTLSQKQLDELGLSIKK